MMLAKYYKIMFCKNIIRQFGKEILFIIIKVNKNNKKK